MTNRLPENIFYNVEEKDLANKKNFVLVENDIANAFTGVFWFDTLQEALNHLLTNILNTNKTLPEIQNMGNNPFYIYEKDGKLYEKWVFYDEADTPNDYPLFKEYTEEKPKNLEQLGRWLENGNYIRCGWYDRAPIDYFIQTRENFEKSYTEWMERSKKEIEEDEDEKVSEVVCVSGKGNSGKTTWIRTHYPNIPIHEFDPNNMESFFVQFRERHRTDQPFIIELQNYDELPLFVQKRVTKTVFLSNDGSSEYKTFPYVNHPQYLALVNDYGY